jgi:tetratricopeptide (TPR) repeat protein
MDPAPKTAWIQDRSMAIARSPRDPKFYVERAQAYEANGQYDTALADLDQAMTLRPDSAKYRYLRGIAYALCRRRPGSQAGLCAGRGDGPRLDGRLQRARVAAVACAGSPDP